jgi:hypothetical protein
VNHQARLVHLRIDFPQLLDADAVGLRIAAGIQVELVHQLLAQMAARAFGKQGVLRMQFHAELEGIGGLAFTVHAHVAGGNALDRAVVVVQDLCRRKAREDFHAQRFSLLAQPARDIGQRHHVIAMVLEAGRQHPFRRGAGFFLGQEHEAVFADRGVQRRAQFAPVGEQLVHGDRVHHRAGQDVGADLAAFFQYADRDVAAVLLGQLLQADRSRQAARSAADDDDVILHRFARTVLGQQVLFGRCAFSHVV